MSSVDSQRDDHHDVPPFTLTLSHNDHRNTVIYGPDWEPMYHIETKPCTSRSSTGTTKLAPTLVFRQDDGGQIYPIASLEFGDYDRFDSEEDIITYGGVRQPLSWLLPRRVAGRYVWGFSVVSSRSRHLLKHADGAVCRHRPNSGPGFGTFFGL